MKQTSRQQLLLAFYVPSALIAIAYSVLLPILPVYAGQLTNIYFVIGIILASEAFGRLTGDIPASWLIRRLGMKRTMLTGLCLAFVPIVLLFFFKPIIITIVLLFLSGIGHALYNISRHAYITVRVSTGKRGRAIGLLGGVFRAGRFVGPIIGGWVGGTFGLPYAFLAFGLLALATIFFVWRFMQNAKVNETTTQRVLFRAVLKERGGVLASAGFSQILAQLTREGWLILIPLYAANILKLDVQTIGIIMGVGSALDMLFFYFAGMIMDRFGRKWAIVPSFIIQGFGVTLIPLTGNAVALAAVAAFIGFANGLSSGTMMTVGADLAPPDMRGEFLSLWRLIGDTGFVAGPMLVGFVAQAFVLQMSVLTIAGTGFGAALLFTLLVPETRHAVTTLPATSTETKT